MSVQNLTVTQTAKDSFYPTPDDLAQKMIAGIYWDMIESVLEPSAGKGNLVEAVAKAKYAYGGCRKGEIDIDCIEIDPYLRQILKYNFSEERVNEIRDRYRAIDQKGYQSRTEAEKAFMNRTQREADTIGNVSLHIVHDDFLTFRGGKRYDLILMNPPFADGDKHLLKALELQQSGGAIVCLLNAETILNPYTASRQQLKRELDKYGATLTMDDGSFSEAERRTDVKVAIVKIDIPRKAQRSTIYERMEKAVEQEAQQHEVTDIVKGDYLEQAVQRYTVEVSATLEFIREYEALKPYMSRDIEESGAKYKSDPILTLVVERDSSYHTLDINRYLRVVRLKYWRALFKNEKFVGKLTSNLRKQYTETVDKMADYDFTLFNIKQVMVDMNSGLVDGVKTTILDLFDKLTSEHSWYPECSVNRHYFNGWSANKAHKIGSKSIIPTYGMFTTHWDGVTELSKSKAYEVISDIEKAFNYLDGNMTAEVDLNSIIEFASATGQTRNIECKYFKVDVYKKGTMHIKYTNPDLVEKLNIYAAKNKNWLPPNYGKAKYSDMKPQEKTVVDEFQGEKEYNRIVSMAGYFLAEPTRSMALLED